MTAKELHINISDMDKSYGGTASVVDKVRGFVGGKLTRRKCALKGINLEIREGDRVGVIGENGAGKSTLLKIIAGTLSPSRGHVDVKGDVHAVLTLGVGLREELTGRANLYLDAEAHGRDRLEIEPLIEEMIDFSGLGEFIDRPVNTYSSGMKSRLVFASLVFVEPEILILDETLSTGDQWFQVKAKKAVQRLCDKGKIVIIVSHSMEAIQDMCSRCIWIKDGSVFEDGRPDDVISKYVEFQDSRVDEKLSPISQKETHWSNSKDSSIVSYQLFGGGEERDSFQTGGEMVVEVTITELDKLVSPTLVLELNRADGLRIIKQTFIPECHGLDVETVATASIKALPLSSGLFECSITLFDGGLALAKRSRSFKVRSEHLPRGGKPLFLHPITVVSDS